MTRKQLIEFLIETRQEINRTYKGESNNEPLEMLADSLIKEGFVVVDKPRPYFFCGDSCKCGRCSDMIQSAIGILTNIVHFGTSLETSKREAERFFRNYSRNYRTDQEVEND